MFNITYRRRPFFLRRDIQAWRRDRGLDHLAPDATRKEVFEGMGWKPPGQDGRLGQLFRGVGLTPFWGAQEADTMDSHRLAWYAASVSPDKGEAVWRALSERYFEGKTDIEPVRLDNPALLMEAAEQAGLDLNEAHHVISTNAYYAEVHESFMEMQRAGINSIPVLIFEVVGSQTSSVPLIHHGSGSTEEFVGILKKLHAECLGSS